MLTLVGRCLRDHGAMSVAEVARCVDADPEAVRGMLDHWCRNGRVVRAPAPCDGCTACDLAHTEYYQWNDRPSRRQLPSQGSERGGPDVVCVS